MTSIKTLLLSGLMTGALIVPALAMAQDGTAPAERPGREYLEFKRGNSFEEADKNKDGSLTQEEFLSRHVEKFKEIDQNSDGKAEKAEFDAYGETMRQKMQERREQKQEKMMEKSGNAPAEAPAVEEKAAD